MADSQRIQKSYLGESAQRLTRSLSLDGLVSPDFDSGSRIQPVALVADGTLPGMGDFRGRRWSAFASQGAAGSVNLSVKPAFAAGVIVEALVVSSAVLTQFNIALITQANVQATGGWVNAGFFLDRNLANEPGPMQSVGGVIAGLGILAVIHCAAGGSAVVPFKFHLSPEVGLAIASTGAGANAVSMMGQLF